MTRSILFLAALLLLLPKTASAHGVGQAYALPVPLAYYLTGAGLAVAASFAVIAFFLRGDARTAKSERRFAVPFLRQSVIAKRYAALLLLVLCIAAGAIGNQSPVKNFDPYFFWFYFLIGVGVASVLVGNIWDRINPFRTLARLVNGKPRVKVLKPWLGAVGTFLLLALSWWELVSLESYVPKIIASVLLGYAGLCIVFDGLFGEAWWERGEATSLMYRFFGRLAFLRLSEDDRALVLVDKTRELDGAAAPGWMIGVACALLAGVALDGLQDTAPWWALLGWLHVDALSYRLTHTVALALLPCLFFATYMLCCFLMSKVDAGRFTPMELARRFVWSLAPVAFGYALAHNISILVSSIPMMISLISDPFGWGWNLFHTASFSSILLFLGAKQVWFLEIGLVVVAHVVGILYAHVIALNLFPNRKTALLTQVPMALLMVGYTMLTLWLLSLPLVVGK